MKYFIFFVFIFFQLSCKQSFSDNNLISQTNTKNGKKLNKNTIIYDFETSYFSKLIIEAKVAKFDSIYVTFGDLLNKDGRIIRSLPTHLPSNVKIYLYPKVTYYDVFEKIKPNIERPYQLIQKDNIVQKTFPFRYVEIENNNSNNVKVNKIYQKSFFNKFNDSLSYFSSSDTILNKIWSLCKHTIKATNFSHTFIDGDRERRPYEGDAYINLLSYLQLDTSFNISKNTLEYLINNPTWPTEYNLIIPELFYSYTLYSGDLSLISKYYDLLTSKTLIDLRNNDGIISTNKGNNSILLQHKLGYKNYKYFLKQLINYKKPLFYNLRDMVDWPQQSVFYDEKYKKYIKTDGENDNYDYKDYNTVINAYHYNSLIIMNQISRILKKNDKAQYFSDKANVTKKSFKKYFFNKKLKLFVDGLGSSHASLHSNMFSLKFSLVDENLKENIILFMKKKAMSCSPYGAQFLLDAFFDNNEEVFALNLITNSSKRSWKNMLDNNACMTFESWDLSINPEMDLSHSWSTAPLNIINRKMWGIEPNEPGFKSFTFKPKFGNLKFSYIIIPTINGLINGTYKFDGKQKHVSISFPNSMKGEITFENIIGTNSQKLVSGKVYEIN